jgi:prefoldin alpha subunit
MKNQPKLQNEQELQQMYMQLQQIDTQISEIDKELRLIEQKRLEFLKLSEDLGKVNDAKANSNSFSNVGAGIFAETKLTNTKEFMINVGANTYVKKSLKEVQALLNTQSAELEKAEVQLQQNMQMLNMQAQIIQAEMQKSLGM